MEKNLLLKEDDEPPSLYNNTLLQFPLINEPSHNEKNIINKLWPKVTNEEWNDWKWQMKNRVKTFDVLSELIPIKPYQVAKYKKLIETFHYSVTPYYLSIIDWSNPDDPIRKQAIPSLKEIEYEMVGENDPLHEEKDMQVHGLVHRYPDRVLAIVTDKCAMYCRHCTRKRIWQENESVRSKKELMAMVEYLKVASEVREVIISGGDPLTLNIDILDWFLGELRKVSHLEVIRIGTRVPVVLPMRITNDLVEMLSRHRPLWINTQFNHPNEITPEAKEACDKILRVGIPVSNQSVLLKGVNDSVEIMKKLCHGLQRIMVRPYYLFQCDPVKGVEHFRTSLWKGIEIIEMMRGHTGGLAIPTFVVDAPNGGGKIPLQPFYILSMSEKEVLLRNYEGMIIRYFNPQDREDSKENIKGKNILNSFILEESPRYKRRKKLLTNPTT